VALSSSASLAPHPRARIRGPRLVRRDGALVHPPLLQPSAPAPQAAASVQAASRERPWWDGRAAGWAVAVALAAVAGFVLTAGIGTPSPWADEGATYLAVQRTWQEIAVLWQGRDAPWVPYYALAKAWTILLHAVWPGMSTLVALRLLSAVTAAGTVLVLYAIIARNAGRIGGILAALMLVSLPGFSRYAQEARGYSLLALAAAVSWLLSDRWLRPGRIATLTGTSLRSGGGRDGYPSVGAGGAYALGLAAVAAVHTFGVFQWPAHLVSVLAARGERSVRARRAAGFALLGLVAVALAGAQLWISLQHGTGPTNAQAARIVTIGAIGNLLARAMSFVATPVVSVPVLALALVGLLSRVEGKRQLPLNLLIWLVIPLTLAIGLGVMRTNLFRLRYWIAFLPPLAGLAGLGLLAVGTAIVRLAVRGFGTRGAAPARVLASAVVLGVLGLQAAVTAQAQQQVRAIDGHSEDLGPVLAAIARERAAHPGLVVAISSPTGSGMLAASDPALLAQNPLQHISATLPVVWTSPTAAHIVRQDLAGAHEVLWVHRGVGSPAVAARHLPHTLAQLHPTVISAQPAGPDWTVVLLRT